MTLVTQDRPRETAASLAAKRDGVRPRRDFAVVLVFAVGEDGSFGASSKAIANDAAGSGTISGLRRPSSSLSLPWDVPSDLSRFRRLTSGRAVIMGRRTYESIPHPLKDRTVIVLSRNRVVVRPGEFAASSLAEAVELAAATRNQPHSRFQSQPSSDVVIVGGEGPIREAIESGLADIIHLTRMRGRFASSLRLDIEWLDRVLKERFILEGSESVDMTRDQFKGTHAAELRDHRGAEVIRFDECPYRYDLYRRIAAHDPCCSPVLV